MKPTTKFHKDILRQSRKLRPVTNAQKEWAINECFEHFAFCASAESINSKIKAFIAKLHGVNDTKFLIFRLCKIYA